MNTEVKYNGYEFSEYSHVTVRSEMVEDDAARTVLYHRSLMRVQTIIVAEGNDTNVGDHFRRIRQLLSKAGGTLVIHHDGFGPRLAINSGSQGVRDVNFGPKPRVIEWTPVGATNAVEVIWECEFCLPTCEGLGGVRFEGLSSFNYAIGYKIDRMGYTTRTIAGHLEIAMTRVGLGIPDTADAYRNTIQAGSPANFQRESQFNLSLDKRRLDFTITDAEVVSANRYPAGVVEIRANHRVGWARRSMATLPSTINAAITLVPGIPRGRAWEIFRSIVADRLAYASGTKSAFLEGLEVDEELYGEGTISFQLSYRVRFGSADEVLAQIFSSTGIFQPTPGDWIAWKQAISQVQTYRGIAQLSHNPTEDQIVDLCTDTFLPDSPSAFRFPDYQPTTYQRFCNVKPPPNQSYIKFEGVLGIAEESPSVEQITIGQDDLVGQDFDPSDPAGSNGQTDATKNIQRFIESAAAGLEFIWEGYAERVGYDIPRPGKLTFGNITLVRKGRGEFYKRYIGKFFCQPVYAAGWRFRYVVDERPPAVSADESDPINTVGSGSSTLLAPGAS